MSIIPFDFIQIWIGWNALTRLNRIIKVNSLFEFFNRWDKYVQTIVYLIRFFTLFYYEKS